MVGVKKTDTLFPEHLERALRKLAKRQLTAEDPH
jgi:hypothetical protein